MKKNNKCKSCGGKGWYYDSYAAGDLDATKLCPDCQPPDFPELTKQQKKDQTEFIKTAHKAKIFEPEAQTEQKECGCHCHHHGNCVEDAACIAMYCEHCLPQPTDGLLQNWEKDAEVFMSRWPDDETALEVLESWLKDLLAEQKTKTREDTLNNIEAIWTRLMNETDDPAKKEVYANCVKALRI